MPMLLVANRNVTVRTKLGHTIKFEKDVPKQVPDMVIGHCMEVGVVPVEDEYKPEEPVPQSSPQGDPRIKEMMDAINVLRKRNERNDFTAAGKPDLRAMRGALGWAPDRQEVDKLYKKMLSDEASEE